MNRNPEHSLKRLESKAIEQRRAAIVESARRVVQRKGVRKATVRNIAEEAQATTGAVYHYFKSQHHVLAAVYEGGIDSVLEALADLEGHSAAQTLEGRIRETIHRYLFHLARNSWVVEIALLARFEMAFDREARGMMAAANERLIERLNYLLLPPGFESSDYARRSSEVLLALINGLLVTYHRATPGQAGPDEAKLDELMQHVFALWFDLGWQHFSGETQ